MMAVGILRQPTKARITVTTTICQQVIRSKLASVISVLSCHRRSLRTAVLHRPLSSHLDIAKESTNCSILHVLWIQKHPPFRCNTTASEEQDVQDSFLEKVNQIRKERGKIMSVETRNEMKRKLALLAKYGCRLSNNDKLQDDVEVLNLSVGQIKKQGDRLKSARISYVTPDLFLASDTTDIALHRLSQKQLEYRAGVKGRDILIKKLLECRSETEWNLVRPHLRRGSSGLHGLTTEQFLELYVKIEYLISQGYKPEYIKINPALLSQRNVKQRIEWVKKTIPFVKIRKQLDILTVTGSVWFKFKRKYEERLGIFLGCRSVDQVNMKLKMLDSYLESDEKEYENLLTLQTKVNYIKGVGYTEREIAGNLLCLLPSLQRIRQHVESCGDLFTVDIMQDYRKSGPGMKVDTQLALLRDEFKINQEDLDNLQTKAIAKNVKVNNNTLCFLLQYGYSLTDIVQHVEVLGKQQVSTFQRRSRIIMEKDESKSLPSLRVFLMNSKTFKMQISRLKRYEAAMATAQSKAEAISILLNLEISEEKILDSVMNEKLSDLKGRILYLYSEGISSKSIVNDIFCLHIPLSTLKFAVSKLKKIDKDNLTLSKITEISGGASVNKSQKTVNIGNLVKIKLGLRKMKDWKKVDDEHFTISAAEMNQNFKLLINEEFSVEDLRSCPYILGHSFDILQEALTKLRDSEELLQYPDLSADKVKLLNFLQYTIEVEHGFRPVVNDHVLDIDETDSFMLLKD